MTEQELLEKVSTLEARVEALERERLALREREQWLRTALDALPAGVWFADATGEIVLVNPAGQRIWGGVRYVGLEQYGEYRGWWADTGERVAADQWALARAFKGEVSLDEVIDIECFDGARKTILNSGVPIRDDAGAIVGAVVFNLDISAQKQTERRLSEALERLRSHVEHSPLAVIEWSEDFRVTAWNPAAERMFGRAAGAVLGVPVAALNFVHPDDIAEVQAAMADMLNGARRVTLSANRNIRADGRVIHCEWYNSALYDRAGRLVSVLSQVLDVTDRRRAEDEARASELRATRRTAELQAVLDTVPAVVWIARDRRGDRIDANRHGVELLGVPSGSNVSLTSPDERRLSHFRVMKDGQEVPPDELPIQAAARFGRVFHDYECDVVFADGGVRHLLGNTSPICDAAGEPRGSVGAFIDITERKRAEARAEALARFPEENPDPVLRLADDLTVVYANNAASAGLRGLGLAVGQAAPPPLAEPARWALQDGQRRKLEVECGGVVFTMSVVPVGAEVNIYGQDITARKQAEAAVLAADRRKTEFLAMLSHELRNPLTPIRNSVHILGQARPDSELASRARDVIERQTEHLTRLVNDLLDLTRISCGKIELQRCRLDLSDVVRRACDDYRSMFERADIELRLELPPRPVWVDADATRLAQVIGNLLSNAKKFTPARGRVSVALALGDDAAEVAVRDTGVGIAPEQLEAMFEPFAQADRSLARTQGGLGLGLALVKGLVELHGGQVRARSGGAGLGVEFTFTLPLAPSSATARAAAPEPPTRPRSILIVEDNIDAGDSLAALLELEGHHVQVARDGTSAIALARTMTPDLVLCDIGLPDIDGYAVARALRSADPERRTRLVAVSGYALPEDLRRAAEAGFEAHLPKPPPLAELMALIARR